MCGNNPPCSQKLQDIVTVQQGISDCDDKKCSWDTKGLLCKSQRGAEVCEKITEYYNPFYVGTLQTSETPIDNICDDEKGKHVGTYQCLGNVKVIWGL